MQGSARGRGIRSIQKELTPIDDRLQDGVGFDLGLQTWSESSMRLQGKAETSLPNPHLHPHPIQAH